MMNQLVHCEGDTQRLRHEWRTNDDGDYKPGEGQDNQVPFSLQSLIYTEPLSIIAAPPEPVPGTMAA